MTTPETPKGEAPVALGTKVANDRLREGFAVHTAGQQVESNYSEIGRNPSLRQGMKPSL
jgi:hypothetical protein